MRVLFLFVLLQALFAVPLKAQKTHDLSLTGIAQRENGQWYTARQTFNAAKLEARRNNDWEAFVQNTIRESEVLAWAMKPDSARAVLQQTERACVQRVGNADPLVWRLKTFGLEVQQIDGAGAKVLKESQRVLEYWKSKGKEGAFDLALAHLYIGKIRSDLGDFGGAVPELETAVLTLKRKPEQFHYELQDAYSFLGNVYLFQGRFEEAKKYLKNAEALAVQIHPAPHFRTANVARLYATIDALKGAVEPDTTKSRQALRLALTKYEQTLRQLDAYPQCNNLRAMLYSNISLMHGRLKNFDASIITAKQAQDLYEKGFGKRHVRLVKVFSNLGIAYETKKNYQKSYECALEAVKCLAPTWEPRKKFDLPPPESFDYKVLFLLKVTELGTYLDLLYTQNKDLKYLEAAYDAYNWVIEAIDRMRNELDTEDALFAFQTYDHLPQCYEHAIQTACALYALKHDERYLQQALSFMEKRKSSQLYTSLQGQEALRFGGIPNDIRADEKGLKSKLSDARRSFLALPANADENERLKLSKERAEADALYSSFLRKLAQEYPDYYNIQYSTSTLDLDEVQDYLGKHKATLLEYHISTNIDSSAIYIVKITPDERKIFSVRINDYFADSVRYLLKSANNTQEIIGSANDRRYFNAFTGACHRMFNTLLAPVLSPSDRNLIIVADDVLYLLPFEMLLEQVPPAVSGRVNYGALPWVIRNRSIRYAFSTGLMMHPRLAGQARKTLAAFAPAFSGKLLDGEGNRSMSRLRFAHEEAQAVAAQLGGVTYLGEAANKKSLQQIAEDFQIIHLASHAVTNADDPPLSYIALGDTGRLYSYELYDWQIHADMAVLSACNTGNGKLEGGEGVMSIARAFRYAGCPNLLVSLWQVDDESTRVLMELFYRHFKNGMPRQEALRQAKLDYLDAKHKVHPYFWAPFVLLGDDETINGSAGWSWWTIAGLAAGALLLGGFLAARRRLI